ncbi:DUF4430 domain-containing protein [Eremococcus coleocola]|uniref:Transcobalamin-like C-terminal domain-containing protein n=1 Tax=Eremococcus coleocola ACS-139-V-Col8 TaxID=908337 RepID=E4KMI4_9LACT|nr:DUF4430 domain-containing protein [Eremococcus coleocola]EFR31827.1 hypothetical protein HMPREF9257_0282 [Eremococcus coleocola ACS-139-V-Col8]
MKNNLYKFSLLSLSLIFLFACSPKLNNSVSETGQHETAVIEIKVQGEDQKESNKEVQFDPGMDLLSVMHDNYTIQAKEGLVEGIDGLMANQGQNKGRYWKLIINDQMSQKGAKEIIVKDNDRIVWDLTDDWDF